MISKSAKKKALKQAAIQDKKQQRLEAQQTEAKKSQELAAKTDKYGVAKEKFSFLDLDNRWIVVLGGILLVSVSLYDFIRSSQAEAIDPVMLQQQIMADKLARGETLYDNPQLSLFERLFCRGAQTSSYCPQKPLHPILQSSGTTEERWEYLKEQKRLSNGAPDSIQTRIILQ